MRLGLFGGTFDPIHYGHLILAERAREAVGLDEIWFVVAGAPPHKPAGRTPAADRVEMVRIAIAGNPAFAASELDVRRPGPHYSVDLLEIVREQRPADDLFFLIGADSLRDLPGWRQPDRIAAMATLVVANRPGVSVEVGPEVVRALGPEARAPIGVAIPEIGIASREIRQRLAEGRSVRYLLPRGVEAYIQAHGLYQPGAGPGA